MWTTFRPAALAAVLVAAPGQGVAAVKGPDAGGYVATDAVVYSFVDIASTGGASIFAGVDDATALLTLAFPFNFYGQPHSAVCVSSNGAVYFINVAAQCAALNDFANIDLSSTAPPLEAAGLFPFWSDLTFQVGGAGSVLYQTIGQPGSRRFIVQWNNAFPQGSSNPVTFQLILSEGSNGILFQYRTVDLGSDNPAAKGGLATVAIRNAGGLTTGQQLGWSYNAPVLGDSSAVSFSSVTTTAPVVLVNATPSTLWPPNNKPNPVKVFGTVTLGSPAVGVASATYAVVDEYGQVQPTGPVTVAANGSYSVGLMLMASRNGNDQNGRTYTITIRVVDTAGNIGTGSTVVLVPHDRR